MQGHRAGPVGRKGQQNIRLPVHAERAGFMANELTGGCAVSGLQEARTGEFCRAYPGTGAGTCTVLVIEHSF